MKKKEMQRLCGWIEVCGFGNDSKLWKILPFTRQILRNIRVFAL